MAIGRRIDAIWILGNEVIQPRGLIGQAQDSLDYCGAEIRQVFEILADVKHYPIYFHCTSGKDRTGLVALLLLMILQIPPDAISADYIASEGQLVSEKGLRIKELRDMGLSADFAGCPLDWVTQVQEHISQVHGSLEIYLSRIGVGLDLQGQIRQNMLLSND